MLLANSDSAGSRKLCACLSLVGEKGGAGQGKAVQWCRLVNSGMRSDVFPELSSDQVGATRIKESAAAREE